jgi:Ca2+-dependent lipid-binding protein
MVKEIVEPILASTLPGPLSSLRFTKVDLGQEPIRISEVDVHKTQNGGIKLDMDIVWDGKSDIDLEGSLIPKLVTLRAACNLVHYHPKNPHFSNLP